MGISLVWINAGLFAIQLNIASGGPAGGQTFEKFDKQGLKANRLTHRCCKPYGSGLTSMLLPFRSAPQGLSEKEAATGKFSGLISKSDPSEA